MSPFDCCILHSTLCSVLLHVLLHPVVHAHATVEPDVCGAGAAGRSNLTPSLSTWILATLTPIRDLLSFPFSEIVPLPFPSLQVQKPRQSESGKLSFDVGDLFDIGGPVDSDTKVLCSHSSRFAPFRPRQNSESPSNLDDVRDLNRLLATSGGRDMPFGSFGLIRPAAAHVMESIHFFA